MIDTSKQYTYNGKPVRIYADGSDTQASFIHGAVLNPSGWSASNFNESDLVEVWEPKEGEWCFFWDKSSKDSLVIRKYKSNYKGRHIDLYSSHWDYCAPFKGELPEAFKGLV